MLIDCLVKVVSARFLHHKIIYEVLQPRTPRHTPVVEQSWVCWLTTMREGTHHEELGGISVMSSDDQVWTCVRSFGGKVEEQQSQIVSKVFPNEIPVNYKGNIVILYSSKILITLL